ncbi:MAG: Uma2 family endonuclease [Gemmataceae bacterium]|nr:Uma2 family endonuclease [Gemmataceae bacterium]
MNAVEMASDADVEYPDSDGQPMSDNTLQYEWIVALKGNLELLFADRPDVFVAGDNLIYPVRGNNKVRQAPDVYVAFGRPKGHRGSYKVWAEGDVFPQVVFEVWSPGNRAGEMSRKRAFYRQYGAEEYYLIDPDDNVIEGWLKDGDTFREVADTNGFVSPRLGVTFRTDGSELAVFYPDGGRFLTFLEIGRLAEQRLREVEEAQKQAEQQKARAEQEKARAEQEKIRADRQQAENDRLRVLLRAAGIDPDRPAS